MLAPPSIVPGHQSPKAVILDVDGVFVDSIGAHARSWLDVLAEGGHRASYEHARHLIGLGDDAILLALTGLAADNDAGRQVLQRRLEIFRHGYLPYLRSFPAARAIALRMRESGITRLVASSASPEILARLLDIAEVRDLVETVAPGDDDPDPDIVRAALRRAGAPPGRTLMIAATPYDIEAAGRAGVRTIALRGDGGWSEQDLAGAVAIFDDPLDLLIHYDESPLVGRGQWVTAAAAK